MFFALLGAFVTTFSTTLGALPALGKTRVSARTQDILMGFSAGIMLAATCFSLLIPAIETANPGESRVTGTFWVAVTVFIGGAFLHFCNQWIPHEHFVKGREGGLSGLQLKRIWLFIFAIGLHNFPEGLAVGSGAGSLDMDIAFPILAGIALQDLPEGFVVAIAMLSANYSRRQSLVVTLITGLVEGIACMMGFFATSLAQGILPWALAFCGGSMLYVVSDEIIPESHRAEYGKQATAGLILGFVLMMFLDVALGSS